MDPLEKKTRDGPWLRPCAISPMVAQIRPQAGPNPKLTRIFHKTGK